jgi:hypothetical protein
MLLQRRIAVHNRTPTTESSMFHIELRKEKKKVVENSFNLIEAITRGKKKY